MIHVSCFKRFVLLLTATLLALSVSFGAFAAEVVLYSSNQPELLDMVAQGFEKKSGIKVTVVRLGTGEAMKRIEAEKNKPLCDIFWSGDVAVLDAAKANFAPYDSPEAKGLPAGYVEKDKKWTAANTHLMILMVNTKLVKPEDMPKTWADILKPEWKDKIVMANPQKSGSAYAQVYGLYKLFGWDGLNKLIDNAKILDSSSLVYKGTAEGEFHIGITMEYAAYRYVAGGSDSVAIVYPEDGVIAAPEGCAIIAGAQHEAEAQAFFDYLISKDTVSEIYQKYYRRPARPDAAKVEGLPGISEINIMKDFDPEEANRLEKELLSQWRRQVLQKK